MPPFYSRKTPRAQRYDYHSAGMYFVTICTQDRVHYFGHIVDKKMILSHIGKICDHEIHQLNHRKTVDVHERIVMPNHVHVLLYMNELKENDVRRDASSMRPISKDGLSNRPYDHNESNRPHHQNEYDRPYG